MHLNPSKAKIAFGCPVLLYKSLTEINPLKPQRDGKAPRVFVQAKKNQDHQVKASFLNGLCQP